MELQNIRNEIETLTKDLKKSNSELKQELQIIR